MELRHFRYFLAVARHLNFHKAAEALHISQPPLSRQIKELEEEIGTALFARKENHTALTSAGEYLCAELERILEVIDATVRTARIIGNESVDMIRVGSVSFLLETYTLPMIKQFNRLHPDIKIDIYPMPTAKQEGALRSGMIDVGFLRLWQQNDGLVYDWLFRERLTIIFPLTLYNGTDPRECMRRLAAARFIMLSEKAAPGLSRFYDSIFKEYGATPPVKIESNDTPSILPIVAAGLGWSIIPDLPFTDEDARELGKIDLPQGIDIGICHGRNSMSVACTRFIAFAKDYFSRLKLAVSGVEERQSR